MGSATCDRDFKPVAVPIRTLVSFALAMPVSTARRMPTSVVATSGQMNTPAARHNSACAANASSFVTATAVPRVRRIEVDVATEASDHQPILIEIDDN